MSTPDLGDTSGIEPTGGLEHPRDAYRRGFADGRKSAQSPVQPVPPNHPDDGHPHSWGCRRCGVDHPVQPVLSGLDEALDDIDNGAGDESHVRAVVARIRRLAATAPAAKTPPDPFDPDQRYLEDRTAPAADEGPKPHDWRDHASAPHHHPNPDDPEETVWDR